MSDWLSAVRAQVAEGLSLVQVGELVGVVGLAGLFIRALVQQDFGLSRIVGHHEATIARQDTVIEEQQADLAEQRREIARLEAEVDRLRAEVTRLGGSVP